MLMQQGDGFFVVEPQVSHVYVGDQAVHTLPGHRQAGFAAEGQDEMHMGGGALDQHREAAYCIATGQVVNVVDEHVERFGITGKQL
ncbi:hypothetical protein D9M70_450550 [compost metagenome]